MNSLSSFRLHPCFCPSTLTILSADTRARRGRGRPARGEAFGCGGGEGEAEARAAARLALDLDCAAVLRDDLADDDEAEARAPPALLRRVERVEDVRAHLLGHART